MRSFFVLMIIFALPAFAYASDQCAPHDTFSEVAVQKGTWISAPISLEGLEKEHMSVWLAMKDAVQPGDQIYFISHREGIFYVEYHALVRDGCIIRRLVGRIS